MPKAQERGQILCRQVVHHQHVIEELKQTLGLWPAPILKEVSALNSMDIFSGCGGLSVGLGQAGVANNEWAKDISEPAAEAYKKNFPGAEVYNQECNSFLKQVMEGSLEGLSKKEVEIFMGGPTCQGFSVMNNFREGEKSQLNNSQIATSLSYVDVLRPHFVILENVQNLVQIDKGMVLKHILVSLVKMGYPVGKFVFK